MRLSKISAKQVKMARMCLDWTQYQLAKRAGMSKDTVLNFENGKNTPHQKKMTAMIEALEQGGIEFLEGHGVRERQTPFTHYRGTDGFRNFLEDVYAVAKSGKAGDICLYNSSPQNWVKHLGFEWNVMHSDRMAAMHSKYTFRAIVKKDEKTLIGKRYTEYRTLPEAGFNTNSFYVYGDRFALLNFDGETPEIFKFQHGSFADGYRGLFMVAWDQAQSL